MTEYLAGYLPVLAFVFRIECLGSSARRVDSPPATTSTGKHKYAGWVPECSLAADRAGYLNAVWLGT